MYVNEILNQNVPCMCGHRYCTDLATGYIERSIDGETYYISVCDVHRNLLQHDDSVTPVERIIKILYIEYIENDIRRYIKANHDVGPNDAVDVSEGRV